LTRACQHLSHMAYVVNFKPVVDDSILNREDCIIKAASIGCCYRLLCASHLAKGKAYTQ
jgi:hypothetical protein